MKKIATTAAVAALALTLSVGLVGCGGEASESTGGDSAPQQAEQKQPLDLTGTWEQVNKNSEDSYHEAVISGDTIEINWITNGGDTKTIYWAGTYEAPTTTDDSYTWESTNDHAVTDKSMLGSTDDVKTFEYSAGVLSYEAKAMGSTMTIKMERK